jgi:2-polyprenyl-3-methyl-5-hydroxy-6-metoxy-1,4-benzoquinol methylase
VGCGTEVVLRELVRVCREGNVIGTDLPPEAVVFAREKASYSVFVDNIETPTVLGIFDVLEHFPDDDKVVTRLNQMLKPGGVLIITVPAHLCLWSYFDVAARHCRRYAPAALAELLLQNGFEIEYLTQFMASLFPLIWLMRRMATRDATVTARELLKGRKPN